MYSVRTYGKSHVTSYEFVSAEGGRLISYDSTIDDLKYLHKTLIFIDIRPSVNNILSVFFSDFSGNLCVKKFNKA